MKTSMQLNALVRNLSKKNNINAEIILRNYMFERLLERVALSEYQKNFILKGGVLISAIVGIDTRTTLDLDATIQGHELNRTQVESLFKEIINVNIDDNIVFTFLKIEEIHEESDYPCYRVSCEARLEKTRQTLKIDITSGDSITPREIEFSYKLMFEDRTINLLAYSLETVLAEKIEGILTRGETNTRMRDFYDVYIITKTQTDKYSKEIFKTALRNTAQKRNTLNVINKASDILRVIERSSEMIELWQQYLKNNPYAANTSWDDVIKAVISLIN